jgi:hypothetical protein
MEETLAFASGEYKKFNGVIMWGDTECVVENSNFSLINNKGGKVILWYNGKIYGGMFSNGIFLNGLFKNSKFKNSIFKNGKFIKSEWISGEWENGLFVKSKGDRFEIGENYVSPYFYATFEKIC